MRFFKLSQLFENDSVCCCIVFLLLATGYNIPFTDCADILGNYSVSLATGRPAQYHQSESSKPVTTSFASLTSVSATQISANPFIQNYAISDLTRDLSLQLKSIQDHELLIPTIQSVLDSFERVPSSNEHNDTKILKSIASKIDLKLAATLRILNETNQKIFNIFASENIDHTRKLLLDATILPCIPVTKHSERSAHDSNSDASNQNDKFAGFNKKKAIEVLNFLKNAGQLQEHDDKNYTINKRLMDTLKTIDLSPINVPNFRDVFFLPKNLFYSQISHTNCRNTAPNEHHRFLYASSVTSRKIILIVDFGATATNSESLEVTKSFAQTIINLLNDNDQVMPITISNTIHTMNGANKFHPMDSNNRSQLKKFIDSLEKDMGVTNHSLAFQYTFEWIKSQFDAGILIPNEKSTPLQILYISRGLITQLSETKTVLEVIAAGQLRLKQPVVINTCAIILDEKRSVLGKEFLSDIAQQNYSKYSINVNANATKSWFNHLKMYNQNGKMFVVNHRNTNANDMYTAASGAVTDIWFRTEFLKPQIIVHQPFYDSMVEDQVIYVTKSCQDYGIVGISIYLSDLAEDLIYHFNRNSNGDETYAFLCDKNGVTIWHPSFPRPNIASYEPTYPTDIIYFEKVPENIRQRWLHEDNGIVQISKASSWNKKKSKVYRWRHLSDWYIVCLVHVLPQIDLINADEKSALTAATLHAYTTPIVLASTSHSSAALFKNIPVENYTEPENKLVFHRLDVAITPKQTDHVKSSTSSSKLCQYFKQISILDTPTLYLSPRSFKSPFQHLSTMCQNDNTNDDKTEREQCFHRIENIMAFIKDTTNLLTNFGLQPHVRGDVQILSRAIDLLRVQHQFGSKIEKYVIRRYITSVNGIMLMYPGFALPNDFDPSRRSWFQKAMTNPEKLTITQPYLDIGGAGYIVTISYVIFEKVWSPSSNRQRNAAAIVSIDVTLGFLYQVLLQSSDNCRKDENIKCFLIDDHGYLVVYPNNFDSKMQFSMFDTQFNLNEHLTHRESLIANDILLHKSLVEKRMCQNLLNRKVERYYKFNLNISGALSNVVNGERTKYQIKAVPNTNLFVIMKNSTDSMGGAAFCPCSTVDKVCFNCKRVELMNCECPCECPIENLSMKSIVVEYMYGDLLEDDKSSFDKKINLFDGIEICPQPSEEYVPNKKSPRLEILNTLDQCVNFTCELYSNQLDCLGILGCVWCEIDIDHTILLSPFCTHQSSCFGGILGSNTPYGDGDIGVIIDSILPSTYAAIGPIAIGAVVVLFFVIGFAMYCYRNNLEPGSEQLYVESMAVEHNFGLPLSRLDYDIIMPHNGLGNDIGDKRNHIGTITSESPYRSASYFRRLPNGESDHGYSTMDQYSMTPHDDSDHACFTLVEPLINNKSSNQSISDSTSFNTEPSNLHGCSNKTDGFASPVKTHYKPNSELASPHHIQAPVTVHHPMEAIL